MFKKILIANRGEISLRIQKSLRKKGIASVAVFSDADCHSLHMIEADEAYGLGPGPAGESYLNVDKLLEVAKAAGVDALHPGYGFLSENADFAERCEQEGIVFIGPTPKNMRDFGLKHTARELAAASDVPLLPGTGLLADVEEALSAGERIGYPLMLKTTAGGGGIGMAVCESSEELMDAYARIERLGQNNFNDRGIFAEKYVQKGRHIEVQIFGDGKGYAVALGERDCSTQRRNQKVIEETPAPGITEQTRTALIAASIRLAEKGQYRSAGTVEFIYEEEAQAFYFLEVNTRLQVEHGVTEEVTGVDLVAAMIDLAAGELHSLKPLQVKPQGCAMQVRVYAEDPARNFRPSTGVLTGVHFPEDIRVDTWVRTGTEVPPFYDPLLAKLIVKGATREDVIKGMSSALAVTRLHGIETNIAYLAEIIETEAFKSGNVNVKLLDDFPYQGKGVEVIRPGTQTSVQDWPGRQGYWVVGVPPSGPMDALHFRLANRLVGNSSDAAALEITVSGPTLRFQEATQICLTGAEMFACINDESIERCRVVDVASGDVLKMSGNKLCGQRAYLAFAGGLDVPEYLGSRSTFMLGQFGGHGGRKLQTGDVLHLSDARNQAEKLFLSSEMRPELTHHWDIGVLYGPHGAPDFFTPEDMDMFFSTDWGVHFNSDRTGVRLIGPKPTWARKDGGEAGLHPSNIHDNAYAIGTVDFTGDMPIILGPDGPSLGGFVCPATLVQAELWKMGQLKPGDSVRFIRWTAEEAAQAETDQETFLETLVPTPKRILSGQGALEFAILFTQEGESENDRIVYRRSGDKYLLVEFGPLRLDLKLRFKAHAWMTQLEAANLRGIIDLTPGIRSLQIHYESRVLPLGELMKHLKAFHEKLSSLDGVKVPSRIVHLPISWDDEATHEAIQKYMRSVRPDAPWCPSNIEFIRRINGLSDIQDVQDILFEANYLVMGLGDVYLGAPVATPLDPRHRLVTTKYNPARTWTAENSVGIGGAYLCVYGMEGPGGYQFVGRTLQMWNRYNETREFEPGKPWLLRFFDQLRFFPVSHDELMDIRRDFLNGTYHLKIEESEVDLDAFHETLEENQESIDAFKSVQQQAFDDERDRWRISGQAVYVEPELQASESNEIEVPEGCEAVLSPVSGSVWKLHADVGAILSTEQAALIVESMKMEIDVFPEAEGCVESVHVNVGAPVSSGQTLMILRTSKPACL